MRRSLPLLALLLLVPAARLHAEEKVSPKAVHAAVQRGADWLRKRHADGFETETWHSTPEIVVLTLLHAQVDRRDPLLRKGIETIETCPLTYTYRVATMAMALSHLDPYRYRARLAHCAQWLVDTQLPGGEWGYPGNVQGRAQATHAQEVKPPVTAEEAEGGPKAPPIVIARRSDPESLAGQKGDFSNTQFAILGLRACRDARIEVPVETWQAALTWMESRQLPDGGWGYSHAGERDEGGYASATAAGAAGAAICAKHLKKSPRSLPAVKLALGWLTKNWVAERNAGLEDSTFILPSDWQCYHLYSVERAGRILGFKKIGKLDWYQAGARWLLGRQKPDGSWNEVGGDTTAGRPPYLQTADTCFAILFLTLATPPLTR